MLSTFLTSFKYSFAQKANKTIYNIKRIPFIGKKISDRFYKETETKMIFGIIGLISKLIYKLIGKAFFIFLFILLPALGVNKYFQDVDVKSLELQLFIILCFLWGPILMSVIFNKDSEDYKMLKLMRMNPKNYYMVELLIKITADFIFFMPFFIFLKIANPLNLLLELSSLRILGEYINIVLFKKFSFIINKNKAVMLVLYMLVPITAYVPAVLGQVYDFKPLVNSYLIALILIFIALIAFVKLLKYDGYKKILIELSLESSIVDEKELSKDINFGNVEMNKVNKKLLDSSKFEKKTGYEYLNSIFFYRNNRVVRRSLIIKCIIIMIIFVVMTIVSIISKEDVDKIFASIKGISPLLVFLMYILSSTERLTKAMFYNCDLAMLRYGFYKRREDILSNFKSRIKKVIFYNLLHTFVLVAELSLFIVFIGKGEQFTEIIPILISIISLSCFFAIYSVFMYYILQPYTKDLEVKSPTFSIVNFVMYSACYGISKIKSAPQYFTIGVIAVTVMFIPISLYIIYKKAPKTFKLK